MLTLVPKTYYLAESLEGRCFTTNRAVWLRSAARIELHPGPKLIAEYPTATARTLAYQTWAEAHLGTEATSEENQMLTYKQRYAVDLLAELSLDDCIAIAEYLVTRDLDKKAKACFDSVWSIWEPGLKATINDN